jgi:hypothetical protein
MEAAMKGKKIEAITSLAVALAMVSVFNLRAFAAPAAENAAGPVAVLVSQGEVRVNGEPVETGATVLSGSEVETLSSGFAEVDLGRLGRVILEPATRLKLEVSAERLRVVTGAGLVRLRLAEGEMQLSTGLGKEIMRAGEVREVSGLKEAVASGRVVLTVSALQDKQDQDQKGGGGGKGGFTNPPPWAWVLLLALAGGIVIGIEKGGGHAPAPVSPIVP